MRLRQLVLGTPLPTTEYVHQRLRKVKALVVFSSEVLSAVVYATKKILLVLVTVHGAVKRLSLPIALTITGLRFVATGSYYQTIHGYPSGGGAYIVAHENLGLWPGLIAASALMIDDVLLVMGQLLISL
jgi:amino acid transporter